MPVRYSFGTQRPDRNAAGDYVRYEDFAAAVEEKASDYEFTKEAIEASPQTFMPALLATAVQSCIDKKVFRDHKAIERFVVSVILEKVNPNGAR